MAEAHLRRLRGAAQRRLSDRRELRIYDCRAEKIATLPHPHLCQRDDWKALQALDRWSYESLTRDRYLDVVEARRREGKHHLYSRVENGILVHYGWVTYPQLRAPDAALGLEFIPAAGSAALWDYFTHPAARGRGLYLQTLWQCLHDAADLFRAKQVYIYVYADNAASRHVIEKAGFEYRGSLVQERRFFRTKRYATYSRDPLDVRLLHSGTPAETRQDALPVVALENHEESDRVIRDGDGSAGEDQLRPGPARQQPI
jgi:RimJ/RimL family protein N-acetyltransferase